MLTAKFRRLIRTTVPVLEQQGEALTRHFYNRMFEHNPELRHIFNASNQETGQQQRALATAVLAYARNIDDPAALMPILHRVAQKHASIGIRAEHYPIVGGHLLASIREVLGEAATDELIEAWGAAYNILADLFIGLESDIYKQAALANGGWSGWRPFKVGKRVPESEEIASFYLYPVDGGVVPTFVPGQFVSVRGRADSGGLVMPRQYSLSDAPNNEYLRLSVKRERGQPDGVISNWLHDSVKEGDLLELSPPVGDFVLKGGEETPLVLISGGVGLTPMVSMLNHVVHTQPRRPVVFVHGARHGGVHAFKSHIRTLAAKHKQLRVNVFYEKANDNDRPSQDYDYLGRVDLTTIKDDIFLPGADYYICGPVPFMKAQVSVLKGAGIPDTQIHYEVFGPQLAAAV